MSYPDVQLNKLKGLLERFHFDVPVDDLELDVINRSIFDPTVVNLTIKDRNLRDTIFYLKDLVKLNGYTCVEELEAFYEHKVNEIRGFIRDLTDNSDRKQNFVQKKVWAKNYKHLKAPGIRGGLVTRWL